MNGKQFATPAGFKLNSSPGRSFKSVSGINHHEEKKVPTTAAHLNSLDFTRQEGAPPLPWKLPVQLEQPQAGCAELFDQEEGYTLVYMRLLYGQHH